MKILPNFIFYFSGETNFMGVVMHNEKLALFSKKDNIPELSSKY